MFEAKLKKAELLKKVVDATKDIVLEAPFDFTQDGISLQAMDASHVALVSLHLETGLFDTFKCDVNVHLGLSMKHMASALKCAGTTDSCLISYDDKNSESIQLTFVDDDSIRKQV
jgi:proliferating cell nuclear antigen